MDTIHETYEPVMKRHGYETYLRNLPRNERWRLGLDSNAECGVFLITQVFSLP
jgi:hypothetical protein